METETDRKLQAAIRLLTHAKQQDSVRGMIDNIDMALSAIGKALLITTEPEYAHTVNYGVIHTLRTRAR